MTKKREKNILDKLGETRTTNGKKYVQTVENLWPCPLNNGLIRKGRCRTHVVNISKVTVLTGYRKMVISQLIWVKKLHHGDDYGHFFHTNCTPK